MRRVAWNRSLACTFRSWRRWNGSDRHSVRGLLCRLLGSLKCIEFAQSLDFTKGTNFGDAVEKPAVKPILHHSVTTHQLHRGVGIYEQDIVKLSRCAGLGH